MGRASATTISGSSASEPDAEDRAWDERASALYERMRRPAAGLVRRAYGSLFADDEIEDLYSSAWLGTLRALRRRHAELDDEAIRSYLLTAVANQAHKEMRRRKRKPVAPLEAAGAVADAVDTPEDVVAIRESDSITRDVLSSLPPRRRAVMLLRYGWGLKPGEICGMVDGLSPRAYRKEVTRGVDELVKRIKLVEEGRWCEDRESVLKAYAAGVADPDQVVQAKHHLSHCRHCHEFVGRLSGHLHDVGSAVAMPGALEVLEADPGLLERIGSGLDRARDTAIGALSRSESGEAIATAAQVRGTGAAAAGVTAKLAGFGTAAKVALACVGGGMAASACVATGVLDVPIADGDAKPVNAVVAHDLAQDSLPGSPVVVAVQTGTITASADEPDRVADSEPVEVAKPTLAQDTPPQTSEFGVEAGAAPVGSSSAGQSLKSAATAQEFGP